jgi:hypothetical protein
MYQGHEITLRPLTSWEIDEAEKCAMNEVDKRLIISLALIKAEKLNIQNVNDTPPELYKALVNYYKTVEYYLVLYGMKDFMPSDFSIADVKLMQQVHEIAGIILKISKAKRDAIREVINTPEGKALLEIVYTFYVPLTDSAWKLTNLQKEFLYLGNDNTPKQVAKSFAEFDEMNGGCLKDVLSR